ncbi:unnamed protein product [Paramecium sonneborni]|uniref:MORN repeat-containing protein 3 n=1 Tax=Paramecium sonneborni TaxID=65129 RepID=A0A8S1PC76_9CILI|nr:unnamed protein product [Paramecium sonneborni]
MFFSNRKCHPILFKRTLNKNIQQLLMQIEFREYQKKYFPLKSNDLSKKYPNIKSSRDGNLIKTIYFQLKSNWNIWKQNFQLEIQYQVSLNHQFPKHILQIIDWSAEIQSVSVYVYITYNCKTNANSLNSFLQTSIISEQQKLQIAEQIIEIASILELSEIQHRNIKLNNFILIDNQTYLTDFGSARTHYNHYTKQCSNSEERQKQNETLFYNSPEIIEIINQDNIDFQESEWAQIFGNDQYKKVILKRNDNWSISIILLQLLAFQTQIPDDIKQFYGYDIAKFDQDIKKQANNPQFRIITEIIKKLSFGKMSAINCLEELKKQIPQRGLEDNQQKQNFKEDQNFINIQLKKYVQINTKVDYQYLSSAQIKQLQQINDQKSQKTVSTQQKQNNNNIEKYEIKNQNNQLHEQINDSKSHFSDENSFQIFSPKNNEEEQFGKANLKQLCDYESASFEEQKLMKIKHIQVNSFNNNEQILLLTQIHDDNLINNQNKDKKPKINDYNQQTISQLQVLNDDKNVTQKKEPIQTISSLLQKSQRNYVLNQIVDKQIRQGIILESKQQFEIPIQQPQLFNNLKDEQQFQNNDPKLNLNIQYDNQQTIININPEIDQSQVIKKIVPNNQVEILPNSQNAFQIEISPFSPSTQIIKRHNSISTNQIQQQKNQQELTQVFQSNLILYPQEFQFQTQKSQEQFTQSIIDFNKDPQFLSLNQIQQQEQQCNSSSKLQIEDSETNQNFQVNNKELIQLNESQHIAVINDETHNQNFQENNQYQNDLKIIKVDDQIINNQAKKIESTEFEKQNIQQGQSVNDQIQIIQIEEMQINESNFIENQEVSQEQQQQQALSIVKDSSCNLDDIFSNNSRKLEDQKTDTLLKIEQLKMLNSQQLFKYQEFLLKIKENKQADEDEINKQLKTIDQISKLKEKLNYTREQEIIYLNEDELNQMNEQQLDQYLIGLQNLLENNDQTQKDNYPSQRDIIIWVQNALKIKKAIVKQQDGQYKQINFVYEKFQNLLAKPKSENFLTKFEFEDLSYPEQIQYCNIIKQLINLELKIQKGYLTQQFQQQQILIDNFQKQQDMILTKSLINFNGLELSKQFDNNEKNNQKQFVNPIRQSSITDEIVPFLIHDFESQSQQYQINKQNSPPPNSRIQYNDKYNFKIQIENLKDFEIWSINPKIKKFQKWKIYSQPNIEIPIDLRVYGEFQQNRKKIENIQFEYGGFTLNNQAHGFGIMMKKPKGAIYEGIFNKGQFIYGIVLELNNESRIQKYIGYYNIDHSIKHGQCKLIWYDEIKNRQFEIYEEHIGWIIFGLLHGEGKRWNTKERWFYIGEWKQSKRCGQGKYFVQNQNDEFILKYSGTFFNNKYHGKGQFYHTQLIFEEGEYLNGKKVGPHLLYKDNILQKTINY